MVGIRRREGNRGPGRSVVAAALCLLLGGLAAPTPPAGAQVNWDAWKPKGEPAEFPELLLQPEELLRGQGAEAWIVVDARPAARYGRGHLPGARSLDARALPAEPRALGDRFARAGIGSGEPVVCYADGADPAAAGRLLWLLELAGHRGARVLDGGLEGWRRAGGEPVRGAVPVPSPAAWTAPPDTARIGSLPWLRGVFADGDHNVLDWRPARVWAEGHVPHSLPFPLGELVTGDGALLPARDLRSLFAQWGPRPREYVDLDRELVILGEAPPGAVPVHPYLAARLAGLDRVRVVPEGFAAWEHSGAPVVRMISPEALRDTLAARRVPGASEDLPPADAILLDVRGYREFSIGHLPGAVPLPIHLFEDRLDRVLAETWPGADRERIPFIVYCYGPECTRSRNATTEAARRGFRRLYWFREGPPGWRAIGERLVSLR